MAVEVMNIPNDETQNYPPSFCILQLVVETCGHSSNEPTKQIQQIRKHYYKSLGTSVINSPCPICPSVRVAALLTRPDYNCLSV